MYLKRNPVALGYFIINIRLLHFIIEYRYRINVVASLSLDNVNRIKVLVTKYFKVFWIQSFPLLLRIFGSLYSKLQYSIIDFLRNFCFL
jgi:hypothetical protein